MSSARDKKKEFSLLKGTWINCLNVLNEMLCDRGWNEISFMSDFESLYRQFKLTQALVLLICNATRTGERLAVFICLEKNLSSPALQHIESLARNITHVIIIFQEKVTALPRNLYSLGGTVPLVTDIKVLSQLYINITRHCLVPPHRKLNDSEVDALCQQFKCGTDKFPSIFVTDPIVQYYGFPIGSVIEILRPMPFYRKVVWTEAQNSFDKFLLHSQGH